VIKKLEVLANIAVVVTAIILCSVLVRKYFFSSTKQAAPVEAFQSKSPGSSVSRRSSIQAGTKISLVGIDWSKSDRTVVLALSTGCHFCSESAPFYQKLQQQNPNNVRLVAVLPQSVEDGRNYLTKLGVPLNDVVQAPLSSVGVSGTPTLLLINHDGVVTDSWVGKLSDGDAAHVIDRINQSTAQ
jgi:thiol-disulfide isomerase/thioredoxin